jgi:hypothetical protein
MKYEADQYAFGNSDSVLSALSEGPAFTVKVANPVEAFETLSKTSFRANSITKSFVKWKAMHVPFILSFCKLTNWRRSLKSCLVDRLWMEVHL